MANPSIQSFGKYQILDRVATGATAEIYKARLEGIGGFQRTFAIKRILPKLSRNAAYISSLVDEAKVAGLLSHANIVQIVDLGQVDDIWYIAMEYVDGRDLGAILARAAEKGLRLPVPHAVFITIELLKGLEYAHQRRVMKKGKAVSLNIIHRDLSPANVLLSFQGEVKLTDFGIARASSKALETSSGVVNRRFDYMSPEQATGDAELDQRSDLFSVGVLLYEMLTGHHPFRQGSEAGTVERIRTGSYVPVSQHNPDVPPALEQIVDQAMKVALDARHRSASAFKEGLDQFFHDAGFIFTHATLASYVQDLFPDGRGQPSPERDPPTVPSLGDQGDIPLPGPAFGADIDDADQETLIRKMPAGWDGDLGSSPVPAAQGHAVGQALAAAPAARPPEARQQPPQFDEQEPVVRRRDDEDRLTGSIPSTASGRRGTSSSGRRRRARRQMVAWVMASMGMLAGVVLGGALTVVVGLIAGFRPVAGEDPLLSAPRIMVKAPQGTEVRIDGEVVGGSSEVVPGTLHRVEVTLQGGETWGQELVLNRGEHRVLIFSSEGGRP